MKDINFREIEQKWQAFWKKNETYKSTEDSSKPKYYVLVMFPYPSGKGLHVGHPLSYVAGDIVARYKRHKGFSVLYPMGFDAFGLPAEQYAIQTGQHPAATTEQNISTYKEQLEILGLSYDWDREVQTCDPEYYKWTQWIFLKLFNSWYNPETNKADSIDLLKERFAKNGSVGLETSKTFSGQEWASMSEKEQEDLLQEFRLSYLAYSEVNWCEALGTVLANDEVINGVSERGGHPVTKKKMRQWFMRTTAYAERLVNGLDTVDFPEPLKEMQRNWIGKSVGAEVDFKVASDKAQTIRVFTTRPDTIFGSTFMVVAPESDLVQTLTTDEQRTEVDTYIEYVKSRSERDRLAEVKTVTGVFTGSYAINPFTEEKIPIWTSEYVLASYGTGAIMAVPGHDSRDYSFAKKFQLPIVEVVAGGNIEEEAFETKEGNMVNSGFLDGLSVKEAIQKAANKIEKEGLGSRKVNYRLRDAGFSRQRYWGEPFPIVYENDIPKALSESDLPLTLPEVDTYKPTGGGESPLASVSDWVEPQPGIRRETDTMPGYAGSSWYWLRYMDAKNQEAFVSQDAENHWQDVDLYIGGSEHAVGHLLYSRFWQKVLFDLDLVSKDEPFKKMVNQGMIQGSSKLVNRIVDQEAGKITYVSSGVKEDHGITDRVHVDVSLVNASDELDVEGFKTSRNDDAEVEFVLEDGKLKCETEVEKMSKRWLNVVNPVDMVSKYGSDTFRMYEMFLGPITDSKPWNTNGIDGVFKFLRKFYNLFHNKSDAFDVSDDEPSKDEWKALHSCIQKVENDTQKLSFNTCVSHFMICVNELQSLKCNKRQILEPLVVLISPFAPHLAEELWEALGHNPSVTGQPYPEFKSEYLVESEIEYPVMINGKMRAKVLISADAGQDEALEIALAQPEVQKWTEGKQIRKVVFVPKRILNLVVG